MSKKGLKFWRKIDAPENFGQIWPKIDALEKNSQIWRKIVDLRFDRKFLTLRGGFNYNTLVLYQTLEASRFL